MCQLHQQHAQDQTLLLQWLVATTEEQETWEQVWKVVEDITQEATQEEAWDQAQLKQGADGGPGAGAHGAAPAAGGPPGPGSGGHGH